MIFSKEIFIIDDKTLKTNVFQYHEQALFETMLARFQEWQRQGKLTIIDVRDSIYSV